MGLIFMVFQNCSPFEALQADSVYPFSQRPDYFVDLKSVRNEEREDRHIYFFDFVVSDAEDPRIPVNYSIFFFEGNGNEACLPKDGVVSAGSNHIRVICQTPVFLETLSARVEASSRERQEEEFQLTFDF